MNYPIPANIEEILALRDRPINEELIATAIAGVINIARQQGQSLEDLTAQVLRDDRVLDPLQRQQLSEIVTQAWQKLPPIQIEASSSSRSGVLTVGDGEKTSPYPTTVLRPVTDNSVKTFSNIDAGKVNSLEDKAC